jgi:hypothetical protein
MTTMAPEVIKKDLRCRGGSIGFGHYDREFLAVLVAGEALALDLDQPIVRSKKAQPA